MNEDRDSYWKSARKPPAFRRGECHRGSKRGLNFRLLTGLNSTGDTVQPQPGLKGFEEVLNVLEHIDDLDCRGINAYQGLQVADPVGEVIGGGFELTIARV